MGARAIAVLVMLEALASLHGLAPPGLAHVRVFVPADAAASAPTTIQEGGTLMA